MAWGQLLLEVLADCLSSVFWGRGVGAFLCVLAWGYWDRGNVCFPCLVLPGRQQAWALCSMVGLGRCSSGASWPYLPLTLRA